MTLPLLTRILTLLFGDGEASIIEPDEAARIVAEHKQQRALALAGDIERIHGEMG